MRSTAPLAILLALASSSPGATLVDVPQPGTIRPGQESGSLLDRIASGGLKVAQGIGGYLGGRVLDFLDVFELDVGLGLGAKAGVEYGLGRTTLGVVEAQRIGLDGRQVGTWSEQNAAYGILPVSLVFAPFELLRGAGEPWKSLAVYGFEMGSIGAERTSRDSFATTSVLYRKAQMAGPWHERPGDTCAVGAEAHVLLVGARARVKPFELVDFLLGFVGIDLDRQLDHPQFRRPRTPGVDVDRAAPILKDKPSRR